MPHPDRGRTRVADRCVRRAGRLRARHRPGGAGRPRSARRARCRRSSRSVAYRVVQEMLTNAVKHGRRDRPVHGRAALAAGRLRARPAARGQQRQRSRRRRRPTRPSRCRRRRRSGSGIDGMRRRVEAVGGRLDVRRGVRGPTVRPSRPPRGCRCATMTDAPPTSGCCSSTTRSCSAKAYGSSSTPRRGWRVVGVGRRRSGGGPAGRRAASRTSS